MTREDAEQPVNQHFGKPLTVEIAQEIQCIYGNYITQKIAAYVRRCGDPALAGKIEDAFSDSLAE